MNQYGLEVTEVAMKRSLSQLTDIGHNIANVNTAAYKSRHTFSDVIGSLSPGLKSGADGQKTAIQFQQGTFSQTNIPNHLSIDGMGFFSVNNGSEQLLTRNGSFQLNDAGILVTEDGYPVSGMSGSIRVSGDFTIDSDGTVWSAEQKIDQIQVLSTDTEALTSLGGGYYRAQSTTTLEQQDNYTIRQGMLENSNVNVRQEFTDLIKLMRQFEMQQKVVLAYDNVLNTGITTVGEF